MAHLIGEYINISRRLHAEPTQIQGAIELKNMVGNFRSTRSPWRIRSQKSNSWQKNKQVAFQRCSSSRSSAGEVEMLDDTKAVEKEFVNVGEELQNLVSEYGWKVRRLAEDGSEMRKVAQIQAEAFHVPVAFFNDVFFQFFQAEVLSGLLYKLRNSPPDRYACLVAQPIDDPKGRLVGVVDTTIQRDEDVLQHLDGAEQYLYISGIAVPKRFRRGKVATVLLKACDALSIFWGMEYLALRAYEDDVSARELYTKAGYRVVSGDPQWATSLIGRRRRVLMIKRSTLRDWY